MPKTIIAIGSKRGPKIDAVKAALEAFSPSFSPRPEFELVAIEGQSGVRHTPASCAELMRGARQRAEALAHMARKDGLPWSYFVGLEGGLDVIHESASSV